MKKQLPASPNLEQLKKQAKTLLKGHQAADPDVFKQIQEHHPRWRQSSAAAIQKSKFMLSDAQLVIATQYGFENWAKLKAHVLRSPAVPADVNALRDAAGRGDLAQLNTLLDAHPELINERGGRGMRTALHEAVGGQHEPAVQLLLERGADPNVRCDGDYAMPLHFAAEKQHFPIIRLLIEHGADPVGTGDYHELEVIGWATAWDYVKAKKEIVDYLLAHGARHNISSAVAMGDIDAIRKLVSRSRTDLEKRMDGVNRRRMPLHLAVVKKHPGVVTALLDLGANIEALDESFFTPLDEAALDGEAAIAQILIDRGAKIRLPAAIGLNRTRDVEKLLRKEPDSLKPGNQWENLIVRAAERSSGEVVEALIRAGASVNIRDNPKTSVDNTSGYTPLHAAAFRGNLDAVKVLLAHGARVSVREDRWHGTPAGWAAYAGHADVHKLILEGPVDIMEATENGLTERILAILAQDPEALNRPFSRYSLYPLYAEGWHTPLAFAVSLGKTQSVRVLLAEGADASVRSPEGRSLYAIAREKGLEEVAGMLQQQEEKL